MPGTLAAMRIIVAASVVLLALTGCAPASIEEPWANCVEVFWEKWMIEHDGDPADVVDVADAAAAAGTECQAQVDANRDEFIRTWSS